MHLSGRRSPSKVTQALIHKLYLLLHACGLCWTVPWEWEEGEGGGGGAALPTGCTLDMAGMGERKQLKAESFPRGSLKWCRKVCVHVYVCVWMIWGYWGDIRGLKDLACPEGVRSGSIQERLLRRFLSHTHTHWIHTQSQWRNSYKPDNAFANMCASMCVMYEWAMSFCSPQGDFQPSVTALVTHGSRTRPGTN